MNKPIIFTALLFPLIGTGLISANSVEKSMPVEKKVEIKKMTGLPVANSAINPYVVEDNPGSPSEGGPSVVLDEKFEGWNSVDISWLPQGWTRDHKILPPGNPGWRAYKPSSIYEEIKSKCLVVEPNFGEIDDWVITPEVKVEDGMVLSWLTYPTPVYYFDDAYVDWSNYEFTEMHIVNDFRVYITENGGDTWDLLKSIAADFEDITGYFDLYKLTKETVYNVNLSQYAGKNIKIGFNVWGVKEGNTVMLDNVSIGYPPLDVAYGRPEGSLYFGLSAYDEFLPASILTVPVYSPVTFVNTSKDRTAKFNWTYYTLEGEQHSDNQRELTVTYTPDYTDDYTTRNNLYDMPVLTGEKEKYATTEYAPQGYIQAGGKAQYEAHFSSTDTYEIVDFGLSVIDPVTEGTATYADLSVPYFGYNASSDYFWTLQMLNGDPNYTMDENTYNHLEYYGNLFFATDEPLVISGIRTNGFGNITRNVKLKAEIYTLGSDWVVSSRPYKTAYCSPEDINIVDRDLTTDLLSFYFRFDEPVVMSKALSPYYLVAISGFRDPINVEYFSPEMSVNDNAEGLGLGWAGFNLKFNGAEYPVSWSSVYNYIDKKVGFYIMLDAAYPWLETETDEITIDEDGTAVLPLDSYYSAEELSVVGLPEWLSVEGTGRYGETKLIFTSSATEEVSASVNITAPGINKRIKVNSPAVNGIESIIDSNGNAPVEIYSLTGVKVNGEPAPGIYILKYADGKTQKRLIK